MVCSFCPQIMACQDASELAVCDTSQCVPSTCRFSTIHRISLNDPTVTELDLSCMKLPTAEEEPRLLPKLWEGLGLNAHVRKLRLHSVGLRLEDVQALATVVRASRSLQHVDVGMNQLPDAHLLPLVEAAGCSETLVELRIHQGSPVQGHDLGRALIAALGVNRLLAKVGIEFHDVGLRAQVDTALVRNVDFSRRRRAVAKAAAAEQAGPVGPTDSLFRPKAATLRHLRSEQEDNILACETPPQLSSLVEVEPQPRSTTWMIWMAHRVFLNDPSLVTCDFSRRVSDDPLVFPKIAAALARNTHVQKLLMSSSGFREIEALAASLHENKTLRVLDLNETRLTDLELILLANAVASNGTLAELRCNPIGGLGGGHKAAPVWQAFVKLVKSNTNLCKLGLRVEEDQYRRTIEEQLGRNNKARFWKRELNPASSHVSELPAKQSEESTGSAETEAGQSKSSDESSGPEEPRSSLASPLAAPASERPADQTFTREDLRAATGELVEILPGRCWVVPGAMTSGECEEWIRRGAAFGLEQNNSATCGLRSNTRTKDFVNTGMARLLRERLPDALIAAIGATSPGSQVSSVYEELRVTQYTPGQFFRAHYDDSVFRPAATESGERGETSTHTVLAVLSEDFVGGATRFWPLGSYEHAVDVLAPRGSLLVFEQRTLLHEGATIVSGVKHVAQTGLMRAPVRGEAPKPVLFQWGPGLSPF